MCRTPQVGYISDMSNATLPAFGGLPPQFSDPATAQIAVLPVPYDLSSTWKKGADRGPAALLAASSQVELYDIATRTEVYRRGIATLEPITHDGPPDALADLVDAAVTAQFDAGRFPVVLGGEHSVSIGAIRAASNRHDNLTVLQIDAHGDTREEYEGSRFNHACVMARAREWCSITQVGIRAIDAEEAPRLDLTRVFFAHDILHEASRAESGWMNRAIATLDEHVYITIDLDAFDPSLLPATGTPEPGGLSWHDVNELLTRVAKQRTVVGFDVVELLPHEAHWASDFIAAKLVYRLLSMIFAERDR
jgi:agmatinase